MSEKELNKLYNEGKIAYKFSAFGGEYGYLKDEIFSTDNMIFEIHYSTIYDWKKIRPDIKTIYIMPTNLEIAKQKTIDRHLPKKKEIDRLNEITEHFNRITSDKKLQNQFDFLLYNNYDEKSEQNLLELVQKLI